MTQRERILALAVGAVLLILGLQWGFNKYRGALSARETRLASLDDQLSDRRFKLIEGAMADGRMGTYLARSLPSDLERAQFVYTQFLLDLVSEAELEGAAAKPTGASPMPGLYTQLSFKVTGSGDLQQLVELLYEFHRRDYLHRIQNLVVRKVRGRLNIDMDVQALALHAASPEAVLPTTPSPRVAESVDEYLDPILNRNPLAPPNRPPSYAAETSPEAVLGQEFSYVARFNDPDEGQQLQYSLVGDAPQGAELDPASGTLRLNPDSVGEIDLTLRATDSGWPAKSSEQRIVIRVVEPKEPEPEPVRPSFDEARQAVLTGLVQSQGEWTAWINVRTQGQVLRLRAGEPFEIGQMTGSVVEVNQRFAVLEHQDQRFVLRPNTSVAAAAEEQLDGVVPASEQPASEQPASEQPASEQPASEQPASEQPASEQPASEQPASEQPASEQPASEQPASEEPTSEEPGSPEPASPEPASEDPAGEELAREESEPTPSPETPATTN
nr:cadherin repeat domain-containing protein [Candidatus Laterigemmans baculatus]